MEINTKKLLNEARECVAKDSLYEGIKKVQRVADHYNNNDRKNQIIALSGKLEDAKRQRNLGTADPSEAINSIRTAILEICDSLERDYADSNASVILLKNKKRLSFLIIISLLFIAAILYISYTTDWREKAFNYVFKHNEMYSKSESYKDSSALAGNWEIDTVFYIQLKRLKNKRKVLFIKSVKVSMALWPTPNDTIYEYHGMEYITNELYAVDDDVVNKKGNTFDIDDLKDRDKKGILNVVFMDKIDLDDSTRIGSIIGRYTTDRNNEFVAEAKKELEKQPDRKCKISFKPCSVNTYCMAFDCSNNLKYKKTLRKVM